MRLTDHEKLAAGVALVPWCRNAVAHEGIYPVKMESDEFRIIIAALEAAERIAKPVIAGGVTRDDLDEWAVLEAACDRASEAIVNVERWWKDNPGKVAPHEMSIPVRQFEDCCGPLMIKRLISLARAAPAIPEGMDVVERVARAICRENCAFVGERPCFEVEGAWPNPNCQEPGCHAQARAALAAIKPEKASHHPGDHKEPDCRPCQPRQQGNVGLEV